MTIRLKNDSLRLRRTNDLPKDEVLLGNMKINETITDSNKLYAFECEVCSKGAKYLKEVIEYDEDEERIVKGTRLCEDDLHLEGFKHL